MSMIVCLHRVDSGALASLLSETRAIRSFLFETEHPDGAEIDLDKAWHGIHFLLTRDPGEVEEPLGYLLSGGAQIGTEDVGYGPARALAPAEVIAFHAAIQQVSPEELRTRFDPVRMLGADIYPAIWDRDPAEDDALGYLIEYYVVLRDFLSAAVEAGQGVVIHLS